MADSDDSRTKAWVETWMQAGPRLERIRRQELRAMSYQQRIAAIDALFEVGSRFGKPSTTSGFVEQQRLFQKARR
jgi:hypothetical protein